MSDITLIIPNHLHAFGTLNFELPPLTVIKHSQHEYDYWKNQKLKIQFSSVEDLEQFKTAIDQYFDHYWKAHQEHIEELEYSLLEATSCQE